MLQPKTRIKSVFTIQLHNVVPFHCLVSVHVILKLWNPVSATWNVVCHVLSDMALEAIYNMM